MTLTQEQNAQLKTNCLAIKQFLTDLVAQSDTDITLQVKFGRCGISVNRYTKYSDGSTVTEVNGFIGGLSIRFLDDDEHSCYHTTAWKYTSYGVELITHWPTIKQEMQDQFAQQIATKKLIMDFKL